MKDRHLQRGTVLIPRSELEAAAWELEGLRREALRLAAVIEAAAAGSAPNRAGEWRHHPRAWRERYRLKRP